MYKELIYCLFLLMFFASCEEYYTPNIDIIGGQLVVEAQITNNPSKNYVRLTQTTGFYDTKASVAITSAAVELVDISGKFVEGIQSGPGYFNFNTVPVSGNNYKLRILYQNETYESEEITMPPLPTISKFYAENITKRIYSVDAYGTPQPLDIKGKEFYADAPQSDALSYYRFFSRSILQWRYDFHTGPPFKPSIYGWISHYEINNFNIAGPKEFSQSGTIEKHPLFMLNYNTFDYLLTDTLLTLGWLMIVDEYGTSKGSYEFHEKMNSQFAATGTLFDPIQTQIFGNITCKTNPKKIAFGYFDLNSYKQFRYFINMFSSTSSNIPRQLFRYPAIPEEGRTVGVPPDWWEY